jgi:hypothetical protein
MKPKPKHASKPKAVLFDLLTALIDSWTLWDRIAGNLEDGRRWRAAYLKFTYAEGRYRALRPLSERRQRRSVWSLNSGIV